MNNAMRIVLVVMIGFALNMGMGCASSKAWISSPLIQATGNPYYDTQLQPLTRKNKFFVSFLLTVTNKTDKDLEIDWNKTRYIHNGHTRGVFVFKGIKPEDVKNDTIPADIILAEGILLKEILPYKLLVRAPLSSKAYEAGKISPGLIPAGKNGILLVVRQDGKKIVEKMTINIEKK
ncbi:MAG: hypothetical protein JRJ02_09715 [Deltaproteobacteria bacterium]|nr:hypothetical protein [Deltaproteobacteria bacterium]MBW1862635.1 hypothetical protein [Deltaproteobacteria bacterium]